jgi:hypothetical protein
MKLRWNFGSPPAAATPKNGGSEFGFVNVTILLVTGASSELADDTLLSVRTLGVLVGVTMGQKASDNK